MKKYLWLILLMMSVVLPACSSTETPPQDNIPVTAPAIGVTITRQDCGNMEVTTDTQILWTNGDTIPLRVRLERFDANGNVTDIARSEIGPGDTFSISSLEAGTYHFYCTEDEDMFAIITVK